MRSKVTDANEKRVEAEIEQLCVDIRRVGPTYPHPQPHVLFGELFDDEQVEQYYEALVGTLKSAKKRGLVSFKGPMLLKGAHDNVLISLVDNKGTAILPINVETKDKEIKQSNTFPSTSIQGSAVKQGTGKEKLKWTPKKQPKNEGNIYKLQRSKSSRVETSSSAVSSKKSTCNNQKSITIKESKTQGSLVESTTSSQQRQPSNYHSRSKSTPLLCARTEQVARLEKEIPQLLRDIRRIGKLGSPYVSFGELFDDEGVEQYYEALVGTLKSAKKRGLIDFAGNFLLKGMHDKVKITILKEL